MKKITLRAINSYTRNMTKRPMLTNILTSGILMSAGDVFAQKVLEKENKQLDYERLFRMSMIGAMLIGPFNKVWFLNLHPYLMKTGLPKLAPRTFKNCSKVTYIATSVFAETIVMAWPYNTSFVFTNNFIKSRGQV